MMVLGYSDGFWYAAFDYLLKLLRLSASEDIQA